MTKIQLLAATRAYHEAWNRWHQFTAASAKAYGTDAERVLWNAIVRRREELFALVEVPITT